MDAETIRRAERAPYFMQLNTYFSELIDVPEARFACTDRFRDTWYNQAYDVVCPEAAIPQVIDRIRTVLEQRDRFPCVYLSPATQPAAAFASRLEADGFVLFERESWMFCSPDDGGRTGRDLPGLQIERVTSARGFERFSEVYREAFPGPEVERYIEALWDSVRHAGALVESCLFLACLGGRPVGILSLYCLGKYAGVYDVATAVTFRRRGIARALLDHACRYAGRLGSEQVFLQTVSGEEGEEAFLKAGFRTRFVRPGYVTEEGASLSHG